MPKEGKVLVEGVNLVTKHARARGQTTRAAQMQTGRIQQPAALPVSRVMLVCPRCDRPTKVTRQHVAQKSIRVCRRCGEHVDEA
jgi:large subunit ribosomal protein L24